MNEVITGALSYNFTKTHFKVLKKIELTFNNALLIYDKKVDQVENKVLGRVNWFIVKIISFISLSAFKLLQRHMGKYIPTYIIAMNRL